MARRADRGEGPATTTKGRGAASNPVSRFERVATVREDDGWGALDEDEPDARTVVTEEHGRSILSWNQSPDIPFDRSINPYRGCEHGCIYCYARPTHAYLGLSPGLDFETRLVAKVDAVQLLDAELGKHGYQPAPISFGANTDPYQPIERRYQLTRQLIARLLEWGHPLTIVTKSAIILRDLDLLAEAARRRLVSVMITVTTLTDETAQRLEPRTPRPGRRLAVIEKLAAAGVPVGVLAAPMIPQINDHELEGILAAAKDAGATRAGYVLLRLPLEVAPLFEDWLARHHPGKADRVMALVRQTRDGKTYNADFAQRMSGSGVYAAMLAQRCAVAMRRLGLDVEGEPLDTTQFKAPPKAGQQLELF